MYQGVMQSTLLTFSSSELSGLGMLEQASATVAERREQRRSPTYQSGRYKNFVYLSVGTDTHFRKRKNENVPRKSQKGEQREKTC